MRNLKTYVIGFFTAMLGHQFVDTIATLVPAEYVTDVQYLGGGLVFAAIVYVIRLFWENKEDVKN